MAAREQIPRLVHELREEQELQVGLREARPRAQKPPASQVLVVHGPMRRKTYLCGDDTIHGHARDDRP